MTFLDALAILAIGIGTVAYWVYRIVRFCKDHTETLALIHEPSPCTENTEKHP